MRTLELIKTTSAWNTQYNNLLATENFGREIYNILIPYNRKESWDDTQSYIYVVEGFSNNYKSTRPVEKILCINNADDDKLFPLVEEIVKKYKAKEERAKKIEAIQEGDTILYKGNKVVVTKKSILSGEGLMEDGTSIELTFSAFNSNIDFL